MDDPVPDQSPVRKKVCVQNAPCTLYPVGVLGHQMGPETLETGHRSEKKRAPDLKNFLAAAEFCKAEYDSLRGHLIRSAPTGGLCRWHMGSACILLITICALLSSSVALLPRPAEDCPWSYNVLDVVYLGPSTRVYLYSRPDRCADDWICNITGADSWTCLDGSLQSPIDLPPSITAAEPAYTADVKRASAKFAFSKNLVVNVTYVPSISGGLVRTYFRASLLCMHECR